MIIRLNKLANVRLIAPLLQTPLVRFGSLVPKQVKQPSLLSIHPVQNYPGSPNLLLRLYTNFSHKGNRDRGLAGLTLQHVLFFALVGGALSFVLINWTYVGELYPSSFFGNLSYFDRRHRQEDYERDLYLYGENKIPKARIAKFPDIPSVNAEELPITDGSGSDQQVEKKKEGFRERKIIEYENRIRQYSTPDKVFRLFATLKIHDPDGEGFGIYMTPDDFIRAITPGLRQPDGLGLDQFKVFDPKKDKIESDIPKDSIFHQIGTGGLISFSDFLFLMTLLSISARHIELAFKIFDTNGDGSVDAEEFEEILNVLRQQTSVGMRHREAKLSGTAHFVKSGLKSYFFGKDGKGKLKVGDFLGFQARMKDEVLWMEFQRRDPDEEGKITERQFAKMLLTYAGMSDQKQKRMIKRVRERFSGKAAKGIDFQQVQNFSQVFRHLNDIDTALGLYHVAGGSIDPSSLKHIVKTVAKADLDDHLLDVVFALFDENDDGRLSQREFIHIMRARQMRGMERTKDLGVSNLLGAVWRCAKEEIQGSHH